MNGATSPRPERWRTFIALPLPDDLRSEIAAELEVVRAAWPRARWARPDGLHVTLRFLGATGSHLVPQLGAALQDAARGQPALACSLGRVGTFGRGPLRRVVWVGFDRGAAEVAALAGRVDAALRERGLLPHVPGAGETARELRPHVTLAREVPAGLVDDVARALAPAAGRDWAARQLVLMRSHGDVGGSRYEKLLSLPLRG
ncbi:MAG TPA: RNA 2',3'-cyclic phosphodiesterase [Candidatus Limnocylindrales bacterium]|nr:RNA 2',3'-cyclic phosphodiesterase [Candidatus Limnocylindrales bacterium]